jgi:hypothetical protein
MADNDNANLKKDRFMSSFLGIVDDQGEVLLASPQAQRPRLTNYIVPGDPND